MRERMIIKFSSVEVKLFSIGGDRWQWVIKDSVGKRLLSEIYRTEEDAVKALRGNKINWGLKSGADLGCPHGSTTREIGRYVIEEFCGHCGARTNIKSR